MGVASGFETLARGIAKIATSQWPDPVLRGRYRHFNAGTFNDVAEGYKAHLEAGGAILVTLGSLACQRM